LGLAVNSRWWLDHGEKVERNVDETDEADDGAADIQDGVVAAISEPHQISTLSAFS
jgi:hypothetical protein